MAENLESTKFRAELDEMFTDKETANDTSSDLLRAAVGTSVYRTIKTKEIEYDFAISLTDSYKQAIHKIANEAFRTSSVLTSFGESLRSNYPDVYYVAGSHKFDFKKTVLYGCILDESRKDDPLDIMRSLTDDNYGITLREGTSITELPWLNKYFSENTYYFKNNTCEASFDQTLDLSEYIDEEDFCAIKCEVLECTVDMPYLDGVYSESLIQPLEKIFYEAYPEFLELFESDYTSWISYCYPLGMMDYTCLESLYKDSPIDEDQCWAMYQISASSRCNNDDYDYLKDDSETNSIKRRTLKKDSYEAHYALEQEDLLLEGYYGRAFTTYDDTGTNKTASSLIGVHCYIGRNDVETISDEEADFTFYSPSAVSSNLLHIVPYINKEDNLVVWMPPNSEYYVRIPISLKLLVTYTSSMEATSESLEGTSQTEDSTEIQEEEETSIYSGTITWSSWATSDNNQLISETNENFWFYPYGDAEIDLSNGDVRFSNASSAAGDYENYKTWYTKGKVSKIQTNPFGADKVISSIKWKSRSSTDYANRWLVIAVSDSEDTDEANVTNTILYAANADSSSDITDIPEVGIKAGQVLKIFGNGVQLKSLSLDDSDEHTEFGEAEEEEEVIDTSITWSEWAFSGSNLYADDGSHYFTAYTTDNISVDSGVLLYGNASSAAGDYGNYQTYYEKAKIGKIQTPAFSSSVKLSTVKWQSRSSTDYENRWIVIAVSNSTTTSESGTSNTIIYQGNATDKNAAELELNYNISSGQVLKIFGNGIKLQKVVLEP